MTQQKLMAAAKWLIEATPGEDATREGLLETPARFAKAWQHWTSGYAEDPIAVLKSFADGGEGYDQMIFQSNIRVWSHCEHRMAPFFGVAHIGYIPDGKVVGLSKLTRLVRIFSHRLQVQERLTQQIADSLMEGLSAKGVGVVVKCRHSCMESRGVCEAGTETQTTALKGLFAEDSNTQSEFMSLVNALR